MKQSKILSLQWRDALKGLFLTMITVIVATLYKLIEAGEFPTDIESWKAILISSFGAGLCYLLKNFLTNSDDKILKKEDDTKFN